ncbi:MAG TPA: hypothetical protein PLB05_04255, partial [Candidatus Omnitrophota bacterium]|nr:hypothetical protein [Candidatus Omnitrophota bacterium]
MINKAVRASIFIGGYLVFSGDILWAFTSQASKSMMSMGIKKDVRPGTRKLSANGTYFQNKGYNGVRPPCMQKKTLIINPQITQIVFGTLVRKAAKIGIKTAMLMRD